MVMSKAIFLCFFAVSLSASPHFPVTGEMKKRVAFWKRVYTEITTREAFLHDGQDLTLVYKKISLPNSPRARKRLIRREREAIKSTLRSIARKKYTNLNKQERRLAHIVGKRNIVKLHRLSKNIRFQSGLRDRYYRGLIRSYAYLPHIKKIFRKHRLPMDLVYLPHVESSFNYNAYSKAGAAGIWQFIRSTARSYGLKISSSIDERRDPLKAADAAARLLKDNYRKLKSWPLALTAYNHGIYSVKKAVRRLQTRKINTIIEEYTGKRFGFASKNFYATFMATVEISKNPEKYFKPFPPPKPLAFSHLTLSRSRSLIQVQKALGLPRKTIKKYNPSIMGRAFRGRLKLPKGFVLKFPKVSHRTMQKYRISLFSNTKDTPTRRKKRTFHIVSKGENLYDIAGMYRVKMRDIVALNEIANPSRIYPGRRLKIR